MLIFMMEYEQLVCLINMVVQEMYFKMLPPNPYFHLLFGKEEAETCLCESIKLVDMWPLSVKQDTIVTETYFAISS